MPIDISRLSQVNILMRTQYKDDDDDQDKYYRCCDDI